jgi:hypothetical protein
MQRIIFTLIFITFSATIAAACECYSNSSEKIFRQAKTIFLGRLVSIGTDEIRKENYSPLHTLTFDVEKKWKGVKGQKITVFTNNQNMCSAFEFREREKYLLYVREDSFVTADCASSVEITSSAAQDRIKDLNSFWFRLKSRLWIF